MTGPARRIVVIYEAPEADPRWALSDEDNVPESGHRSHQRHHTFLGITREQDRRGLAAP